MRFSYFLMILLAGQLLLGSCSGDRKPVPASNQTVQDKDELMELNNQIHGDSLNSSLYHRRARIFLDRKMINSALNDLGKAIELDPGESEYYVTLADAYLMMGKLPNCLEALQKAEKLDPKNNEAMLKMAEVYLVLQDYDNTYKYVKKALDIDTRNPRAYFIRGYALMEVGDTAAAIRNMQNALDQDQQYYEAAVQLGLLYSTKKDPLAEQYFKAAQSIEPNSGAAYYLLGLFYQETNRPGEAIETYQKLLVLDPGYKEAYYNMGYIYLVYYQDFKQATALFTQAIQQDQKYTDAWFNRGYSEELDGDLVSARRDYQKALEIQPNYDRAIQGLNRLDNLGK